MRILLKKLAGLSVKSGRFKIPNFNLFSNFILSDLFFAILTSGIVWRLKPTRPFPLPLEKKNVRLRKRK